MHRRLQFGMRENPASDRRHGSRFAGNIKSDSNYLEEGGIRAPSPADDAHSSSIRADAPPHAAQHQAATGGERTETAELTVSKPALKLSTISEHTFEPLIDSPEAAKLLGNIHVKTLQRYARRGDLPGYQIGNQWYFRISDLDVWLRSQINSKTPTR